MKRRKVLHLLVRHCGDHKKETCKKKNNEKLKKQNKNKQETKRPPPPKKNKNIQHNCPFAEDKGGRHFREC